MILGIPKEILDNELRVAALPETVAAYRELGFDVLVQAGAGAGVLVSDEEYQQAGARLAPDAASLYGAAEVIVKVKQPWRDHASGRDEVEMMRPGALLVSFLHPAAQSNHAMVKQLAARQITALTMDDIPRISRAQPMDALTSMSTVTGYKSVLIAANRYAKFVPMIGTAIGTIKPARFLIVGIGVVGLQAVATAKRLGGTVAAVDIREEARKSATSLGAKVVGFEAPPDLATGQGGYARALPPEWLMKEREALTPLLRETDIAILSALVPGEVAPVLITDEMLREMKPGSVVVDVAIDQGGNCAVTEAGTETVKHGVHLVGIWNIPGYMAVHASWLYARNVLNYIRNLFKNGPGKPDLEDEIVRHSMVTHQGRVLHAGTLKAMGEGGAAAR